MSPALRKIGLTAHITLSIAWLGSVLSFLVLAVVGLTSRDADTVRSAYVAMNLIGRLVIVPLSLAALLSGIVQSLGTHWGLFRYWWVVVKLALTVGAVALLLLHQFTAVTGAARRAAAAAPEALPDIGRLGVQLVGDSAAAVVVLLVVTVLGVYKPLGMTAYGRHQDERSFSRPARDDAIPAGLKVFLAILGLIATAFVIVHLAGGGMHGH